VVHDAYLFLLQFQTGNFGANWCEEMVPLFSVQHGTGKLSMG
jgi:hypothetical protein